MLGLREAAAPNRRETRRCHLLKIIILRTRVWRAVRLFRYWPNEMRRASCPQHNIYIKIEMAALA